MSTYGVARSVTHSFSKRLNPIAKNLWRAPKPDRILFDKRKRPSFYSEGIASRLPPAYFKYRIQSGQLPPNYHWVKPSGDWVQHEATGERLRTDTLPIPVNYPVECNFGLWGGEGIIRGFKKSNKGRNVRFRKHWKPLLLKYTLYSEILDKHIETTVTPRTLDLVDEAYGFDFYILKTSASDMRSMLGMKLKRSMLLKLAREDSLYPDNPEKKAKILKKYAKYMVPAEEAEWCGLTRSEAIEKQRRLEFKENPIRSFQDIYTEELVNKLRAASLDHGEYQIDTEKAQKKSGSFLQRLLGESSPEVGESSPAEDDKPKS